MTQESGSNEPTIRWAGDSPRINAVARATALPIGCARKAKSTKTGQEETDDDDKLPGYLPCTPPNFPSSIKPPPIIAEQRPSESDDTFASVSTSAKKSPKPNFLQRLTSLLAEKRQLRSGIRDMILDSPSLDDPLFTFGSGNFPDTSTPTTTVAAVSRTERSRLADSGQRAIIPMKRHRLRWDESDEARTTAPTQKMFNQSEDDTWMAGLNLDAIVADARQKRNAAGNASFKRFKTTGDLPEVEVKRQAQVVASNQPPNRKTVGRDDDDDDAIFGDDNFWAEVDKLEQLTQTQRIKR